MTTPDASSLASRLAELTLGLVDIPSPSYEERAALDACAQILSDAGVPLRWADEERAVLCAGALAAPAGDGPLVVLAGHLDTVPAQGNIPGRIDGDAVIGLGAADMKGACAVILALLCDLWNGAAASPVRLGAVLFAREELPFGDSALSPALAAEQARAVDDPALGGGARATDASLAIVMEPTAGGVQAGCLGNLNATAHLAGQSAHSARPWQGTNALDGAGRLLVHLAGVEPTRHAFSGLTYTECITATGVRGGVARNVVPGEAEIDVNYRYPPGMSPPAAEAQLRAHLATADRIELIGHAPSGAVTIDSPLAQRLIAATGQPPAPKQAWTPVAEFTAVGVDAVNFGPGDPAQAHQQGEWVSAAALAHSYLVLHELLTSEPPSAA